MILLWTSFSQLEMLVITRLLNVTLEKVFPQGSKLIGGGFQASFALPGFEEGSGLDMPMFGSSFHGTFEKLKLRVCFYVNNFALSMLIHHVVSPSAGNGVWVLGPQLSPVLCIVFVCRFT